MNTYRKLSDGAWGIQCDLIQDAGATVDVTTKAGKVKRVTLGPRVDALSFAFVYRIEDARPQAVAVGDLSGILALFDRAAKRLKFPAIELGAGEVSFRVNIAGERASVPGSLTVVTSERDPTTDRRGWLGRVLRDGTFQPSRECPPAVGERLSAFAADPAGVAGEHGRLTGRCCFCRLPLSDARSTAVGYGETCAGNYGLPWGNDSRWQFQASA